MVEIRLTRGQVAIVDDCDADLAKFKWCATRNLHVWYAHRRVGETRQQLHAVVGARMGITGAVDHKNRNGTDCRRSNLRAATHAQNAMNRKRTTLNVSGYKGVGFDKNIKGDRPWRARVGLAGKRTCIGRYETAVRAALAYDRWAVRLFGEFANVNFKIDPVVHRAIGKSL